MSPKLGKSVLKNIDFLKLLAAAKSKKKRMVLLKEATKKQKLLLVEICYNILKGNFPLTKRQKLRIVPYVPFVRALGRARSEQGSNKIIQSGAGVVSFAALLTPIIIEAIKQFTQKNG